MSLTTRCPTCDTAFHVTPLHLQARGGQVRCGRCGQVFNGFATLSALREPSVDPTSSNAEEALESEQEQSHNDPSMPGLPEQKKAVSPNLQEAIEAEIGKGVTQEQLASEPSPSEFAAASEPIVVEPVVEEAIVGPPEPAVASKTIVVEPLVDEATAEEPDVPGESSKNSTSDRAGEEERIRRGPDAASEGQEGVRGGDYQRGTRSSNRMPPRRALPGWVSAPLAGSLAWAFGSLILLAVLTVQVSYAYRDELSAMVPSAKPYLERYCELIECVPPPWQTKWLNIESSDMQSDSQNPKLITISAKVRNYAPHPQAFPSLQLTLIDSANQPLARRTLSPDAYLGENVNREDAVAPHDDVNIMLHLDSSDLSAAGYRLLLLHSHS